MEGTTFAPQGLVRSMDGKDASLELRTGPIQRLAEIGALCNDSKIVFDEVSYFSNSRKVITIKLFNRRPRTCTAVSVSLRKQRSAFWRKS